MASPTIDLDLPNAGGESNSLAPWTGGGWSVTDDARSGNYAFATTGTTGNKTLAQRLALPSSLAAEAGSSALVCTVTLYAKSLAYAGLNSDQPAVSVAVYAGDVGELIGVSSLVSAADYQKIVVSGSSVAALKAGAITIAITGAHNAETGRATAFDDVSVALGSVPKDDRDDDGTPDVDQPDPRPQFQVSIAGPSPLFIDGQTKYTDIGVHVPDGEVVLSSELNYDPVNSLNLDPPYPVGAYRAVWYLIRQTPDGSFTSRDTAFPERRVVVVPDTLPGEPGTRIDEPGTPIAISDADPQFYYYELPADAVSWSARTTGDAGEVSLDVSFATPGSDGYYPFRAAGDGPNQFITGPAATRYVFVRVSPNAATTDLIFTFDYKTEPQLPQTLPEGYVGQQIKPGRGLPGLYLAAGGVVNGYVVVPDGISELTLQAATDPLADRAKDKTLTLDAAYEPLGTGASTLRTTHTSATINLAAPVARLLFVRIIANDDIANPRISVDWDGVPAITLDGDNPLRLSEGDSFVEPGYSAQDALDGDLTDQVSATGEVDTATPGLYQRAYAVTNSQGYEANASRQVAVAKLSQGPALALIGGAQFTTPLNSAYQEPGYTAVDLQDGDLSDAVIVTGTVDTGTVGQYTLTYRVTDASGLADATERTVEVSPEPSITLSGNDPYYIAFRSTYNEPGYTASDLADGDITDQVTVSGDIDTRLSGTQTLTYTVVDSYGYSASAQRRVVVGQNQAPAIELSEGNYDYTTTTVRLRGGASFTEPGYIATDPEDAELSDRVQVDMGGFDSQKPGTYVVTYSVVDNDGATASESRDVLVFPLPRRLFNGEQRRGLTTSLPAAIDFFISVPTDARNLVVEITDAQGSSYPYLVVNKDEIANKYGSDYKSDDASLDQTIEVAAPEAGDYYISFGSYRALTDMVLSARYEPPMSAERPVVNRVLASFV